MLFKEPKTLLEENETWIFITVNVITAPFHEVGVGGVEHVKDHVIPRIRLETANINELSDHCSLGS